MRPDPSTPKQPPPTGAVLEWSLPLAHGSKPTDSLRTEQTTDPLLTEKDACAYLRVSKRNLYCWRMDGLIPYFKIGRAVRFRKSEVDAALERMRMG